MELTIGKLRRLQQCSTPDNLFVIMAVDHRSDLRQMLKPSDPDSLSYAEMVAFKSEVVRALAPVCSAVLLDPEYGAAQAVAGGALPGRAGLMVAVQASGYTGESTARRTHLLPEWSVEKAARIGASAVKLRLYYHPKAKHAAKQEALVDEVVAECRALDMPLFLEPLSFSLNAKNGLSSAEKRAVVIETARRFSGRSIDVLKAEFPLDIHEEKRRDIWEAACRELTDASEVPWVLLSGGVSFADFVRQTEVACRCGASGVMVGRAVWREAIDRRNNAQEEFLYKTAVDRMVELGDIVAEHSVPWTKYYASISDTVGENWFVKY
jgi:tagatose-1,6-bisphosphate aldolase